MSGGGRGARGRDKQSGGGRGARGRDKQSGGTQSLSQIERQIGSLTSSGAAAQAFKKLIIYVTTKCS